MADYAKMYTKLFNAQTKAVEHMRAATKLLIQAQRETEEMYMSAPEPELIVLDSHTQDCNDDGMHQM